MNHKNQQNNDEERKKHEMPDNPLPSISKDFTIKITVNKQ